MGSLFSSEGLRSHVVSAACGLETFPSPRPWTLSSQLARSMPRAVQGSQGLGNAAGTGSLKTALPPYSEPGLSLFQYAFGSLDLARQRRPLGCKVPIDSQAREGPHVECWAGGLLSWVLEDREGCLKLHPTEGGTLQLCRCSWGPGVLNTRHTWLCWPLSDKVRTGGLGCSTDWQLSPPVPVAVCWTWQIMVRALLMK